MASLVVSASFIVKQEEDVAPMCSKIVMLQVLNLILLPMNVLTLQMEDLTTPRILVHNDIHQLIHVLPFQREGW